MSELLINQHEVALLQTIEQDEDNDCVTPFKKYKSMDTEDFYNVMANIFNPCPQQVLPMNCRIHKKLGPRSDILVLEEQPSLRTITVASNFDTTITNLDRTGKLKEFGLDKAQLLDQTGPISFPLSFPYTVLVVYITDDRVTTVKPFFRLEPIQSFQDVLYKAPLFNIPDSQAMCLGDLHNADEDQEHPTFVNLCKSVMERFWTNTYNHDYTKNIELYAQTQYVSDYFTWAYYSAVDPMFIYNVEWIPYDFNINQLIQKANTDRKYYMDFNLIQDILKKDHGSDDVLLKKMKFINRSDIVSYDGKDFEVGEKVKYFDKEYYILDTIVSYDDYGEYDFQAIQLESVEDGEVVRIEKVNFDHIDFDMASIDEAEIQGKVIKVNDLIAVEFEDYTNRYNVKKIRTARGNREAFEVKLGNDWYILDHVRFAVFDIETIKINGVQLQEDQEYIIIDTRRDRAIMYEAKKCFFSKVNVEGTTVYLEFINMEDGNSLNFSLNVDRIKNRTLMKVGEGEDEEEIIYHPIMRVYDKIMINKPEGSPDAFQSIKNIGLISSHLRHASETYVMNDEIYQLTNDQKLEMILDENRKHLFIPSVDDDIDLKVGHTVVFSDWSNPDSMRNVLVITKFEVEGDILSVIGKSISDGLESKIQYVDLSKFKVNAGAVRKITGTCMGWRAGDLVKAKVARIPNFPKKDVNRIVGFINESSYKYPLALFSNACTRWMDEEILQEFEVIQKTDKRFEKLSLKVEPINLKKIKWQARDMFKYLVDLARPGISKTRFVVHCDHSKQLEYSSMRTTRFSYCYTFKDIDKDQIERYGILSPRINGAILNNSTLSRCLPTMTGGFIPISDHTTYDSIQIVLTEGV